MADPLLVPAAATEVRPEELKHPGLRRLLEGLYGLQAEGKPATLDMLRDRIDEPRLIGKAAVEWQEIGLSNGDRPA